jgi:DNA-binding PucR family transcriptional regulator
MDGGAGLIEGRLASIARAVQLRRVEVSAGLQERLIDAVPEFRGDARLVDLLLSSVESNVTTLLHVLEHGIEPDSVEPPPAALEYARTLAQRGVSVHASVRGYRVGHGGFLDVCLDEVARQISDPALHAAVTKRLLDVSFRYIDGVSEHVISTYQQERERWLLVRSAARAGRVRHLLDAGEPDVAAAEASVGYRLRGRHLGLVCRVPETTRDGAGLERLDRVTSAIARRLGCTARPLFVPYDQSVAWSWLPVPDLDEIPWDGVRDAVGKEDATARVAAGDPAPGIDGFRQTHQQALRAQDVADLAVPGARVTVFADVGPVALLLADFVAARGWVWQVLGPLAVADEQEATWRETLRVFLSTGGSYTATARLLALHRNTVQYRIRKSRETLGYPLEGRRQDVELALRVCHHVGSPMLRT